MHSRRSFIYVNSSNTVLSNPTISSPYRNKLACRGVCCLTDPTQIAGERVIKGIDLKVNYDGDYLNKDRYTLQFAIIPQGTEFKEIDFNVDQLATYPFIQNTIYVTTLYDAFNVGVHVENINKSVSKGYYLVALIWDHILEQDRDITSFNANVVRIAGQVNISF